MTPAPRSQGRRSPAHRFPRVNKYAYVTICYDFYDSNCLVSEEMISSANRYSVSFAARPFDGARVRSFKRVELARRVGHPTGRSTGAMRRTTKRQWRKGVVEKRRIRGSAARQARRSPPRNSAEASRIRVAPNPARRPGRTSSTISPTVMSPRSRSRPIRAPSFPRGEREATRPFVCDVHTGNAAVAGPKN